MILLVVRDVYFNVVELRLLLVSDFLAEEREGKSGALSILRFHPNFSSQVLHYLLADVQTQAYSLRIESRRSLKFAKKLEELRLVFFFNAHSCVLQRKLESLSL